MSRPRDLSEGLERNTEVDILPTTVDDRRRPDHVTTSLCGHLDRLSRRTTGRDNVLDDEHPLVGLEGETPPQSQPPLPPLGKQRSYAKSPADFVADDDPTEGRGHHDGRVQSTNPIGDRGTKDCSMLGMLEYERALEIASTVQTGRELEVSLQ